MAVMLGCDDTWPSVTPMLLESRMAAANGKKKHVPWKWLTRLHDASCTSNWHTKNELSQITPTRTYIYIDTYTHRYNFNIISYLWLIANIYVWPLFLVLVHTTFDLQENFLQNAAQLVQQMPRSSRSFRGHPRWSRFRQGPPPGDLSAQRDSQNIQGTDSLAPNFVPIESYRCPIVIPKDPQISHRTTRNHRKTNPKKWKCLTGQLINWYE